MAPVVRIAVALSFALLPARAAAQVPLPRVELGGHAGALTSHSHLVTAGARFTVNFTPETSVELAAEFQRKDPDPQNDGYHAAALYHVQVRQELWRRANVKVSGLVGAGLGYRDHRFTPQPSRGDVPQAETEFRNPANALLAGVSTEVTVSPRLALRADAQMVFGPVAGARIVAGASVPVGRFPVWESSAADGPLSELRSGQHAWVTMTDGRAHEGRLRRVDAGRLDLALRESQVSVSISDVRRIEVRDSLRNGAAWGGLAGGAAMGTLSTVLVAAFCDTGDDCVGHAAGFVLATAALGAGLGALGGAIVDRFIDGRQVVYELGGSESGVAVAPLIVKSGGGLVGRFGWGSGR
jgi:hypothetical protein